jgi:hypothetical protein
VICHREILETHEIPSCRAFLRVDGEASPHEIKILSLKLRDSLLKGDLLFYHRNLKDYLQIAYLAVCRKFWVLMKSGDLV